MADNLSNTCEGSSGTTVSISNSAGPNQFDTVTLSGAGSTQTWDNTHAHTGSTSMKLAFASSVSTLNYVAWTTSINPTPVANAYIRFYVYLTAYPTVNTVLFKFLGGAAVPQCQVRMVLGTGTVALINEASAIVATTTAAVPLNQWVRIEVDCTSNSGTTANMAVRIFSGANLEGPTPDSGGSISVSATTTSALVNAARIGVSTGATETSPWNIWYDDIAFSDTASPGPLASGTASFAIAQFPPSFRVRYHHRPFGPVPRQPAITVNVLSASQYTETLTAPITVTGTQQISVSRLLAAVIAVTLFPAIVIIQYLLTVSGEIAATATVTAIRARIAALTANIAVTVTQSRIITRIVAATIAVSASLTRMVTRTVTVPLAVTVTTVRTAGRNLAGIIVLTGTTAAQKLKLVTLAVAVAITGTVTRGVSHVLQTPVAVIPAVVRQVTRIFTAPVAVASAFSAVKAKFVTLTVSIAVLPGVVRSSGKIVAAPIAATGSLASRVGKNIAASIAAIPAVTRNISRTVSGVTALLAAQSQIKLRTVLLAAVTAVTGTITRKVMPNLTVSLIIVSGNIRSIARTIQGTFAIAGQTARGIGRVFTAITAVTATNMQARFKSVILAASIAVTSSVKRNIRVTRTTMVAISGYTARNVRKIVAAPVSVIVSLTSGRPLIVVLVTGITVSATTAARLFQSGVVLVFKHGVLAVHWIAGQVKTRWKTGPFN